jgi:hypothetical protein
MKINSQKELSEKILEDLIEEVNRNYFIPFLNVDLKGLSDFQKELLDYSQYKNYEC